MHRKAKERGSLTSQAEQGESDDGNDETFSHEALAEMQLSELRGICRAKTARDCRDQGGAIGGPDDAPLDSRASHLGREHAAE